MIYTPPYKPFAHQAEALRKMQGREAFALLMDMRTGKTKTLLDDFGSLELEGKVQNLLVLAPGGVYETWKEACEEHLSQDLINRIAIHLWKSGNGKGNKYARSIFIKSNQPRILIMNIEALSAVKEARTMAEGFLKQGPSMLAVDESTIIKNHSAKRTKFVNLTLAQHAAYRRILSGLPTPRSPLDLYAQFHFLDWRILNFKSYFAFRNRYAIIQRVRFGGREVPLIKGYRDTDDLYSRIAPHSHRVLLEECYDLPPKHYTVREVKMTKEQERLYSEMKEFATTKIANEKHVTATIVIAQITRLHQILCGHAVDEQGTMHEIPENRTSELVELLVDYNGKAIVWCSYDADVRKVSEALEKEFGKGSVAKFWGGNNGTREIEEKLFLHDDACRFMVATAAAGGRGRTWTVAHLVVYYSNTPNLEHRSQSEERAQAIGKKDIVTYVDLLVRGTVEEKFIKNLRDKIDIASAIMGDGYREWLI